MGFGHRVYKNFDPRAKVMKESRPTRCWTSWASTTTRLLQVAKELERIALEDEYFVSKKLYPNVDFYSGIILEAMGFPTVDVHADLRVCRAPSAGSASGKR